MKRLDAILADLFERLADDLRSGGNSAALTIEGEWNEVATDHREDSDRSPIARGERCPAANENETPRGGRRDMSGNFADLPPVPALRLPLSGVRSHLQRHQQEDGDGREGQMEHRVDDKAFTHRTPRRVPYVWLRNAVELSNGS